VIDLIVALCCLQGAELKVTTFRPVPLREFVKTGNKVR
jgi:hypothetical protein